jgi:hypothetical protein
MSSALRTIQKRIGNKPRSGRNTRGNRKGPAAQQKQTPRRVYHAPVDDDGNPLPLDLSKADPGCNKCYGTGKRGIHDPGGRAVKMACDCVARGMQGDAPWQKRQAKERVDSILAHARRD